MSGRMYTVRPGLGTALLGLLVFGLLVYGLYRVAVFAFQAMYIVGPLMLLLAFILHRETVLGYFRWLGSTFRQNFLSGLGLALLSFLAYPLVCGWLLVKAALTRSIKKKVAAMEEHMRERGVEDSYGMDTPQRFDEIDRGDGMKIRIPRSQ